MAERGRQRSRATVQQGSVCPASTGIDARLSAATSDSSRDLQARRRHAWPLPGVSTSISRDPSTQRISVTYDAGALIAVDRGDPLMFARHRQAALGGSPPRPVFAQVSRSLTARELLIASYRMTVMAVMFPELIGGMVDMSQGSQ